MGNIPVQALDEMTFVSFKHWMYKVHGALGDRDMKDPTMYETLFPCPLDIITAPMGHLVTLHRFLCEIEQVPDFIRRKCAIIDAHRVNCSDKE